MIREVPSLIHHCFLQLSKTTTEMQRKILFQLTAHLLTFALLLLLFLFHEFKHFPNAQCFYQDFTYLRNYQSLLNYLLISIQSCCNPYTHSFFHFFCLLFLILVYFLKIPISNSISAYRTTDFNLPIASPKKKSILL